MPDLSAPPPGRPLKFKTVQDLQIKIDEYFGNCDPHVEELLVIKERSNGEQYSAYKKVITGQQPYRIYGLVRALDTTRETLLNYESGRYDSKDMSAETNQGFSDAVRRAKDKIAEYAEGMLYVSGASHGAQFNLKNNYGWVDQSEVLNKNKVIDDLDDLDDKVDLTAEREEVAAKAKEALEGKHEPRSEAHEQMVATDPPVQNQE